MGDRLEENARDGRVLDAEAHDRAELVVVDAALDRGGERHPDAGVGAPVERAQLLLVEQPAADGELRRVLEAVELQVDVNADLGQGRRERGSRASRIPLVLSMTSLMPRALAAPSISRICG